jgi:hypothetical protein
VHGCGGSIASLLKNETKIFLPIFDLEKILINLRTYIAYNENIASFNVLHKIFI